MPIYALGDQSPTIHPEAYVHPDAVVIGAVLIESEASVWPGAVLRGDYGRIRVGARTSIQDGTIVHCTAQCPTDIGSDCVVGHNAHLEGCTVQTRCLIGSGSVVLHRVRVGPDSLVGGGAVVVDDTQVPPGHRALGVPARVRPGPVDADWLAGAVRTYVENGRHYRTALRRLERAT